MKNGHFQLTDFHKDNYHLLNDKPDVDFSPEKNYAVINRTIEKYKKLRYGINPKVTKAAGDRADILASYGIYRFNKGTKSFDDYMGKGWEKRVYSEKLLEKLKIVDSIRRLNLARGNTKFGDHYLT